jgi:Tfp pilus assembly protein PilV
MSLVELMVAIVLLGVGLLGMAALSLKVNTQQRDAGQQQLAALVVQSRIDSLSSIHCQALAPAGTQSGVSVTRGITERWRVVDGNDIKVITDTVTFAARKKPLAYLSIIPCRD